MSGLSTLTEMPAQTYAGDTFLLKLPAGNFPASQGWTLDFSFRATYDISGVATNSEIDFVSTAEGDNHFVSVAATATADWDVADYTGVIRAIKADAKTTIWRGELRVLPEFEEGDATDFRSWAAKCLENIELVISGRATRDVLNSTIAGQSIGRLTPEQLFQLRDRFKAEVLVERNTELAAQGKPTKSMVAISFVRP